MTKGACFSAAFGPRPRMATLLRRLVSAFHDEIVLGAPPARPDGSAHASLLSMAAYELVENAVVHGPPGEAIFSVTIDPDPDRAPDGYIVRLTTRNRARPADHEAVRALLRELDEAEDPFTVYLGLMTDTAKRAEGSGLGLARIRVEGEMELACGIDGEDLEIIAQARLLRDRGGSG